MNHKQEWRQVADKRCNHLTNRVDSHFLWQMMRFRPQTRDEQIALLEFCYNFGGGTDFPPQVLVELTSQCNLKCTICNHADMQRPHQDMPEDLARKVVDECAARGVWYLSFHFCGEPLLRWRYLVRMIEYAKQKGVPCVATVTNATLITSEVARALVSSGLNSLVISFDGSSPEKYREIRGREYDDVAARIRLIRQVRDDSGSHTPFLSMTLVRTDEQDELIDKFVEEWSPYIDSFDIRPMLLFHYRSEAATKYEKSLPGWYTHKDPSHRIPCRQLWQKLVVSSNGEVTPCCVDIDAELSLGNASKQTLFDMWRGDRLGRIQQLHRQRRWNEISICAQCLDFDWGGAVANETVDNKNTLGSFDSEEFTAYELNV